MRLRWIFAFGAVLSLASNSRAETSPFPFVDRLLQVTSELRTLQVKTPVKSGKKSKEEIQKYIEARLAEEYSDEQIEIEQKILVMLGALDPKFPYKEFVVSLLKEQIAGYYDPKDKYFYLADWVGGQAIDPVIVHELTHALQDQHFNLTGLMKRVPDNDDKTISINALIEGDALSVMMDYSLKGQNVTLVDLPDLTETMRQTLATERMAMTQRKDAPDFILSSILFPYVEGMGFVRHLRVFGGWDQVNKAFSKPPTSSEQVLHPQKYIAGNDPPVEIPPSVLKDRLPKGYKIQSSNVLGELGWRLILLEGAGSSKNEKWIAKGWGGDRLWLVQRSTGKKKDYLLAATVWDSEEEAALFEKFWSVRKSSFLKTSMRKGKKVVVGVGISKKNATTFLGSWLTSP